MKKTALFLIAPFVVILMSAYMAWELPSDYYLHVSGYPYNVSEEDFDDYTKWYNVLENNSVQQFTLWKHNNGILENPEGRSRVETWAPAWKADDANDWHYFEARYRSELPANGQNRAIFQMKSPDVDVQWELHINYNPNDEVILNHRRLPDEVLDTDMHNKVFHIKVASNGREYMVWYNGNLVSHETHQMDPSGNSAYSFRWGMYTQKIVADSRLFVWNVRYGTMVPPDSSNPIVVISKRNAPGYALSSYNTNRNNNNIFLWEKQLYNANEQWEEISRGSGYYSYRRVGTNYCLDGGNGGGNRQNVIMYPCSSSNQNQHWRKINAGSGYYRMQKRNASGYSIDGGNRGENLQNVFLWPNGSSNQNQHWKFDVIGDKSSLISDINDLSNSKADYTLYPNPSKDVFNISFFKDRFTSAQIRISDLSGKIIIDQNLSHTTNQIDVSRLHKGLYMVSLKKDGETSNLKLIKE